MRRADLWVLGNLTIDDVVCADGSTAMGLCGGNAIFAAVGGRLWSTHVGLAARVGPDFLIENARQLQKAGIELALTRVEAPTIHNWVLYESPDQRRFITWSHSGSHLEQSLTAAEVPAAARSAGVCHIAPMPLEVQSRLVSFLAPGRTLVSLDPHEDYIGGAEDALLALLERVDLFLPSRREAALLFGRDAPEEAARAFTTRGPQKYARGGGLLEAAMHATVAASFVVEQRGALAGVPFDRRTAEQRLAWLRHELEPSNTEVNPACAWTNAS
ncbi:MAG: PfkB family carbohydrate kinase [Chloroflexi bacterium]|nr:PfkB family carbohydrate kinase [Chloroflexota bacterium]